MKYIFNLPVKLTALMLAMLVWLFYNMSFLKCFIFIKKCEVSLINHFVDNDNLQMAQAALESAYANPEQVSLFAVSAISNLLNLYILWPSLLLCIGLVVFHVKSFLSCFKTQIKENMNSVQKAIWMISQIILIVLLIMLCFMLIILPSFSEIFIVIAIIITVTARLLYKP